MHSHDYESQENSIVQKLLCKAEFTRFNDEFDVILVILQVTNENAFSPLWVTWKLDFLKVEKKSCSIHLFYGDFHPCSTNMSYHSLRDPLRDTWGGVKSEGWTDHFNNNKMISMSVVYSLSFSPLRLFFLVPCNRFRRKKSHPHVWKRWVAFSLVLQASMKSGSPTLHLLRQCSS